MTHFDLSPWRLANRNRRIMAVIMKSDQPQVVAAAQDAASGSLAAA